MFLAPSVIGRRVELQLLADFFLAIEFVGALCAPQTLIAIGSTFEMQAAIPDEISFFKKTH